MNGADIADPVAISQSEDPLPTTIALTGATGFIGRRIVTHLLEAGHTVQALVRNSSSARQLLDPRTRLIEGNLSNADSLTRLVADAGAVMHIAGAVRGSSQQDFDSVNVDGTSWLLDAIGGVNAAVPLLFFSSLVAREPQLSHYSASKHRAELLVRQRRADAPTLILRPPAVYGPGDAEMLPIFRFMARTGYAPAPAGASSRVSLLYVDDLARATLAWLRRRKTVAGTHALHDGRSGGYDWQEIADIVASVCGRNIRVWNVPGKALDLLSHANRSLSRLFRYSPMLTPEKLRELRHRDWVCDNASICSTLSWQPELTLAEGLTRNTDWMK